jgi:uncharacterized damage-inducible protein DinB
MLDAWTRKRLIEQLAQFPTKLETAVAGLSEDQLETPFREAGWTLRQLVHHIADANINGFVRMKLVLTEQDPLLRTFEQDPWAELPDSRALPIAPSLELLRGMHARWAALLAAQPEAAWERKAMHPERGPMTLESILVFFVNHGDHHIEQILATRRARGW